MNVKRAKKEGRESMTMPAIMALKCKKVNYYSIMMNRKQEEREEKKKRNLKSYVH